MTDMAVPDFWNEKGIYSPVHINRSRMFKDRFPGGNKVDEDDDRIKDNRAGNPKG